MRITSGTHRGRRLAGKLPEGVRPTSSRTREALFSRLGQDLTGRTVLDVFGGSGLLSFEALSRGASQVVICEQNRAALAFIRHNVARLDFGDRVSIRTGRVPGSLPKGRFDVVLADPPYDKDLTNMAKALVERVAGDLVLEHRTGAELAEFPGLEHIGSKKYGSSTLSFYRPSRGSGRSPVAR